MIRSPYGNHIICSYVKHMFDICETYVRQYVYIAFNAYPPLVIHTISKYFSWKKKHQLIALWVISIYLWSLCIHSSLLTCTASVMKRRTINTFLPFNYNRTVSKFNFFYTNMWICVITLYWHACQIWKPYRICQMLPIHKVWLMLKAFAHKQTNGPKNYMPPFFYTGA